MDTSETSSRAVHTVRLAARSSSQVQHCPEYNALLDMHNDLCNALPINDLFRGLISRRVVNVFDKKKLCLNRIEQETSEVFLEDHLHPHLLVGDTDKFYDFMSTVKESDKCTFLVKKMLERIAYHKTNDATGTYTYVQCWGNKFLKVTRYKLQLNLFSYSYIYVTHKLSLDLTKKVGQKEE